MKVNVNKTLVILMFVSFFFPGMIKNVLFWGSFILLLFRNFGEKKEIEDEYALINKRMSLILFAYCFLFVVQLLLNNQGASWAVRLFGLTRCIAGFELFYFTCKRVAKTHDLFRFLQLFFIIYNLAYLAGRYTGNVEFLNIFGSMNSCCALNLVFIPYFFYRKKKLSLISFAYFITFCGLILKSDSSTFIVAIVLDVLVFILIKFEKNIKRNIKLFSQILGSAVAFIAGVFIVTFFVNETFYEYVLRWMTKIDMSRAVIYRIAAETYQKMSTFEKIWGSGNNIIYRTYDSTAAHNMFLEMALIYGVVGIAIMVLEIALIVNLTKMCCTYENKAYMYLPILGGYVMFMFHPFFTTFYIEKLLIILVIYQMQSFSGREEIA